MQIGHGLAWYVWAWRGFRTRSTHARQSRSWQPLLLNTIRGMAITSRARSSTLITSSTKTASRQCNGVRLSDGSQCRRMVVADPHSPLVYCHAHRPPITEKTLLTDKTENMPQVLHDCWNLWIGKHVKRKARQLIRAEMEKPLSTRDEPGYIYAYSLTEGPRVSTARFAYFKIGRTTNPQRRMSQVSRRCNFIPKIVELFPSFPPGLLVSKTTELDMDQFPKCPMSHRVERLIHLELGSLYSLAGFKCSECGTSHREWVRVARTYHANGTPLTDKELWVARVRPVILRWIQFGVLASVHQVTTSPKAR